MGMAQPDTEPELPEAPEAPDMARWVVWAHHHLKANREALMKPPVWFLAAAIGLGAYYFGSHNEHELVGLKDERISFLSDQLSAYKERLRGASPDQAAQQISLLENNLKKANDQISILAKRVQDDEASSKALTSRLGALEPQLLTLTQLQSLEQSIEVLAPLSITIAVDTTCSECNKLEAQLFHSFVQQKGVAVSRAISFGGSDLAPSGIGLYFAQTMPATKQDQILKAFHDANIPFDKIGTISTQGVDLQIRLNTKS
jgi:hypothetical protein